MAKIDDTDQEVYSVIHDAASIGCTLNITVYASKGADVDLPIKSKDELNGFTPLILAIQNGHIEAVQILARLGADLNTKIHEMPPLTFAIQHKEHAVELTKTLIGMGADATILSGIVSKLGSDILMKLNVQEEFCADLGEIFINAERVKKDYAKEHDTSPITFDHEEMPSHHTKRHEIVDIKKAFAECDIEKVIEYVKDMYVVEEYKYHANLFAAAAMAATPEHTQLMVALIQSGYEINREDKDGNTAFKLIMSMEKINGIGLCLLGANADIKDEINALNNVENYIHKAIKNGDMHKLAILLEYGGDANLPTKDGTLPLTLAMMSHVNMEEMFYTLVKNGANTSQYDLAGSEKVANDGIIDPVSAKLIKQARDNSLENETAQNLIQTSSKKFWTSVSKLNNEQVEDLINSFIQGEQINIEEIISHTDEHTDSLSETDIAGASDQTDDLA